MRLTQEQFKDFQIWLDSLNKGVQSINSNMYDPFPGAYSGLVSLVGEMGLVAEIFYRRHVGGTFT